MKNNYKFTKLFTTLLINFCLFFSLSFAATCQSMVNQLKNQWRTDKEIRQAIEDQWCDADRYLWTDTSSKNTNSAWTTQQWRDVLNQLRKEWWTDDEIIKKMNDLWLDASSYFGISNSASDTVWTYTSRSCKVYNIIYNPSLDSYTSPDLKKTEYFISAAYFKRYIDSKNPQVSWCPTNEWWITKNYSDKSSSTERYVAPNGKIYFIIQKNWWYTSEELSSQKTFDTIQNLKYYIRDHNPLINMKSQQNNTSNWQNNTSTYENTHWSATYSWYDSDNETNNCNSVNDIKIQHVIKNDQIILSWDPAIKLKVGIAWQWTTINQLKENRAGYTLETSENWSYSHSVPAGMDNIIFILQNDLMCENKKYYTIDFDEYCNWVNDIKIQHKIKGNQITLSRDPNVELQISTDWGYTYESATWTFSYEMWIKSSEEYNFTIKNNFWCNPERIYTVD